MHQQLRCMSTPWTECLKFPFNPIEFLILNSESFSNEQVIGIKNSLTSFTECRPAVLVVFHHTNDEYYVVPNTSRFAKDRGIPTVDCLFNDGGLLQAQQNDKALRDAMECLKPYQKNETVSYRI